MNRFSLLQEEKEEKGVKEEVAKDVQPLLPLCILKDEKTAALGTTMRDGKTYTLSPCGMKINDIVNFKGVYVGPFPHSAKKKAKDRLKSCLCVFSPYVIIQDIGNFFILSTEVRDSQPLLNMEDVLFFLKNYFSLGSLNYRVEWQKQ